MKIPLYVWAACGLMACMAIVALKAPARGAEVCPDERPIARSVVVWGTVTCNSALVYKLVCPAERAEPCSYVIQSQCPAPPIVRRCFTAEEIAAATAAEGKP